MRPVMTSPSAYAPAHTPPDDGTEAVQGATNWNPDRGALHENITDDTPALHLMPTVPPPSPGPYPEARSTIPPNLAATTLAPAGGRSGRANNGLHVQQKAGVTIAAGDMRSRVPHRNIWRAPTQPWDAGLYVGVEQHPTEQIGQ